MQSKQTGVGGDDPTPSLNHDSSSYKQGHSLDPSYNHDWAEDRLKYEYFFPNVSDFGTNYHRQPTNSGDRAMTAPGPFSYFSAPSRTSVSFCIPPESAASTDNCNNGLDDVRGTDDYTPQIQEGNTVANVAPVTQVCTGDPEEHRTSSNDDLPRRYLRFSPSARNKSSLSVPLDQDQSTEHLQYRSKNMDTENHERNRMVDTSNDSMQSKRKNNDTHLSSVDPSYGNVSAYSHYPSKSLKQESTNDSYGGNIIQPYSMTSSQPYFVNPTNSARESSYNHNTDWEHRYWNDSPPDGFPISTTSHNKTSFQTTHHYCTPIVTGNFYQLESQKPQSSVEGEPDSHLRYYHRTFPSSSPPSDPSSSLKHKVESCSPRRYDNSPITSSRPSRSQYNGNFLTGNASTHPIPPRYIGSSLVDHQHHNSFYGGSYYAGNDAHGFPHMKTKDEVQLPTRETYIAAPKTKQEKKPKEKPPRKKKMYSDYIGVTFNKTHAKFQACITHYRKQYYLGRFMIAADAAKAYDVAARNLKGKDWKINFKTEADFECARKLELEAVADKETMFSLNKDFTYNQIHPSGTVASSDAARLPTNLYRPSPLYAPGHVLASKSWSGQKFPVANAWMDSTPSDTHVNLMSVPIMTPYADSSQDHHGKKLFTTPFIGSIPLTSSSSSSQVAGAPNTRYPYSQQSISLSLDPQAEEIKSASTSAKDTNMFKDNDPRENNLIWK